MIKKIIILIIITCSVTSAYAQNEIEISRCSISEISSSVFSLNYSIKNSFDYNPISKLQVILPFEKFIIQGSIGNGVLIEKDLLFSQQDIDLNADSDTNDSFKINVLNKKLSINNVIISPLIKTTANYQVLFPFNEAGNGNINRITKNALDFTLRNFLSSPQEIIIGLNKDGEIEFKKFNNNLLLIEVVTSDKKNAESLMIDGQKPFSGYTNEKDLTGGENIYRLISTANIIANNNTVSGKIKLEKISKPFVVRLTYYFAISEKLILMNQKIIRED